MPPKRRLVLWLMVGLIATAAIALAVLKVDIVVSANGKIVTSDSEIVIQPVETSVVRSIAVRMGQQVKAGEVLATLDPTFSQADRDELAAKLRNLSATYDPRIRPEPDHPRHRRKPARAVRATTKWVAISSDILPLSGPKGGEGGSAAVSMQPGRNWE